MKSWRDIAMDCLTHVSKVRAAKVPKSAFGHANRRKASPLRVESASRPLRGATSSGFVLPTCPSAAEWRPPKRSGRPLPEPPDGCYRRNRSLAVRARLSQFSLKPRFGVNWWPTAPGRLPPA